MSTIRGRWQVPGLAWLTRVVLVTGVASAFAPGDAGVGLATAAVAAVIAAPLLRVAWLVLRWAQEHDRPFVVAGIGLLGVVAVGAGLAALGIGS